MRPDSAGGKFRCEATLERELRARGYLCVAGVDEVGRGALFGPVMAAAVILSPERPVRGLDDSKLLEPERRETLAGRIRERAVTWAVAAVDAATIDCINIYQASRLAMRLAVARLDPVPDFLLIDAVSIDLPLPQRPSRAMPAAMRLRRPPSSPRCIATSACGCGTGFFPNMASPPTKDIPPPSTCAHSNASAPLPCIG